MIVVMQVGHICQVGQGGLGEARHREGELGGAGTRESHSTVRRSDRGWSCVVGGRAGLGVGVVHVVVVSGDIGVAGGLPEGVRQTADMDWVGWRSLMLRFLLLLTSLQPMLSNPVTILAVLTWSPDKDKSMRGRTSNDIKDEPKATTGTRQVDSLRLPQS